MLENDLDDLLKKSFTVLLGLLVAMEQGVLVGKYLEKTLNDTVVKHTRVVVLHCLVTRGLIRR